jgi:hypothetical protein
VVEASERYCINRQVIRVNTNLAQVIALWDFISNI